MTRRLPVTRWQVWLVWGVTRIILLAAAIIGQRYCDPQFYHFAGQLAAGQFPYHDYRVEYPPLAVLLTLLPALPLLPFAGIAPRPDPAFHAGVTSLPAPDPLRYGAYGVSFAVMMLLVDALTLWLVMRVGRRIASGDASGAIIEIVFSWPGIGRYALSAVQSHDITVVLALTVFGSSLVIIGNLLADVLYAVLDPRIRYA